MSEGFLTDVETVMLFFRICRRYHIEKEEDRIRVLRELTRRKKVRYIRDVGEVVRGKKVLKVGFKPPHNAGPEHYCPECKPKGAL
jgi:hypothetical protein